MSYKELIQIYNNRREKLQSLMQDNSVSLDDNRVLQIRGAIDEISMFISVLEQYHQRNIQSGVRTINQLEHNNGDGLFKRVKSSVFG